jgi:hypothetical protein
MSAKHREKAWTEFVEWCKRHRLRPLPAHPWTLAAYARWCEVRYRHTSIMGRIRAIARVHLLECEPAPDRHPLVTRTLRTMELRHRARAQRAALFTADDAAAVVVPGAKPKARKRRPRTRRERALGGSPRLVPRRP